MIRTTKIITAVVTTIAIMMNINSSSVSSSINYSYKACNIFCVSQCAFCVNMILASVGNFLTANKKWL